ncbi:MAG TPA: LamG domain-containing protein [Candidatus Nanoarchaeia archaeon]|nr:LamG domain-containing protein [Candidatus Nanoarchaeia archaeon]
MSKRGLSDVVVAILIILVVMAAVAIIWKYVLPLVQKASVLDSQAYTTKLSVRADSVAYDPNTDSVSLNVARDAGEGDLVGFMVGLTDQEGNVKTFRQNFSLGEYEARKVQLNFTDPLIYDVYFITITPIFRQNGTTTDLYGIPIEQPIANKTPYQFPSSIIAHWKFDDSLCIDYVSGLNCTPNGNVVYDSNLKKVGAGSTRLGGTTSDYYEAVNDAAFTTNLFTIVAWVNPRSLPTNGFSKIVDRSDTSTGFTLGYDGATATWQLITKTTGNQNTVSIPATKNLNTWEFIAASYSSDKSIIYYNSSSNSFNNLVQMTFPTNPLRIGSGFDGNVDEVMFFNRVLTPTEIDKIRNKYR